MQELLKTYAKRLTNISGRNRSLLFLKVRKNQELDINDLDFRNNKPAFEIIEDLLSSGKSIPLVQQHDPRDEKTNILSLRLRHISRLDKFVFEESGARDLCVGWPFVSGALPGGMAIRCPLLLFPVSLSVENDTWILKRRKHEPISINKSFLLSYGHFNNVEIDEKFLEKNFSEFGTEAKVFLTELYNYLKESLLELNYSSQLFNLQLKPFLDKSRKEYEEEIKEGELKLQSTAVLGLFPQVGSYLAPDYDQMITKADFPEIENFFDSKSVDPSEVAGYSNFDEYDFINNVKEEQTIAPLTQDIYQENALKAVKKGFSLVVKGPPGSGKSQLISNLVADAIAKNKTVLVVCQKRAALDVVYERLKQLNLGDFSALIHDFKNDRKSLYEQIAYQHDQLESYKRSNSTLDFIMMERDFLRICREIDSITEELESYRHALSDNSECGTPVKTLYLEHKKDIPLIDLKQEYLKFPISVFKETKGTLSSYIEFSSRLNAEEHLWSNRKSFAGYQASDRFKIAELLEEIPEKLSSLQNKLKKELGQTMLYDDLYWYFKRSEHIRSFINTLEDEDVYALFKRHLKTGIPNDFNIDKLEKSINECFKGESPNFIVPLKDIPRVQDAIRRYPARKAGLTYLKWLFSSEKNYLKQTSLDSGYSFDKPGLIKLRESLENRQNLEHNLSLLGEHAFTRELPENFDKVSFQIWFFKYKKALNAITLYKDLRVINTLFSFQKLSIKELKEAISKFLKQLDILVGLLNKWHQYLSTAQLRKIYEKPESCYELLASLNDDFEALVYLDQLVENFGREEALLKDKIDDHLKNHGANGILDQIENSLKLMWIEHTEAKYPILRATSAGVYKDKTRKLQDLVKEKKKLSREMLLLKAKERTYTGAKFNRLQNRVTYRDLYHQVTKKRRIWPIRRTVAAFHNEMFDLVPCWLMSPESVSAIFPLENVFDLVIFDEASQCYVEQAIPSLFRAKQVVVCGDDKQLRPTDLYSIKYETDEEKSADEEVESLLDLSFRYLPRVLLQGHYRSSSYELIAFSNKNFYENRLKFIPDFERLLNKNKAITFNLIKEGLWENNKNENEADRVVERVLTLIKEGETSIGVITFNYTQQQLIQDILFNKSVGRKIALPDALFVKNIENVQGDEREVIIFSIGYAKNSKGKFLMNFGTLNRDGGENRLNVAITRAKKKIEIFCSVLPQEFKTEDLAHNGPKLLKEYLEYCWKLQEDNSFDPFYEPQLEYNLSLKNELKNRLNEAEMGDELFFADISISKNGAYKGLLLTDDSHFMNAISAKQQEFYLPRILEKKNWKHQRIYTRDFWYNPDKELEKLRVYLNQL